MVAPGIVFIFKDLSRSADTSINLQLIIELGTMHFLIFSEHAVYAPKTSNTAPGLSKVIVLVDVESKATWINVCFYGLKVSCRALIATL